MRQILPGIHTWAVFSQEKGLDFNGHLVVNEEGCAIVDPPPMSPEQIARVEELGRPTAVVITNCHHTRDATAYAGRWKIPILLNDKDALAIPKGVRLGGIYRNGDRLAAGLVAVELADQKSPGESALLCRAAGAIILGDALIGAPPGSLRMLPDEKYAHPARARAGLRRLLDLSFDAVLVGDGASIPEGGRTALEEFLAKG